MVIPSCGVKTINGVRRLIRDRANDILGKYHVFWTSICKQCYPASHASKANLVNNGPGTINSAVLRGALHPNNNFI